MTSLAAPIHGPIRKQTSQEAIQELRAVADRMEPKMAREFLDAMNRLRDKLDLNQIAELIEQGRTAEVLALLEQATIENELQSFAAQISTAVIAGADAAASLQEPAQNPQGQAVNFVLDATNPRLSEVAQTQSSQRIREIGNDVRAVTQSVIRDGTTQGDSPLETARRVRESVGLTERQERAISNYRRALERGDPQALDRDLRDRRFDGSARRAVEGEALSQDKIDRMTERYRQRYIKYRSEVIARTESTRSIQGAQHALFKSYIEQGRISAEQVRKFWHYTRDERTRASHRQVPALNPNGVGIDEEFETPLGGLLYPGDPSGLPQNVVSCRCTAFYRVISAELLEGGNET